MPCAARFLPADAAAVYVVSPSPSGLEVRVRRIECVVLSRVLWPAQRLASPPLRPVSMLSLQTVARRTVNLAPELLVGGWSGPGAFAPCRSAAPATSASYGYRVPDRDDGPKRAIICRSSKGTSRTVRVLVAQLADSPRRYLADIHAIRFDSPAIGKHRSEIEHACSAAIVDVDHHAVASRQDGTAENVFFPIAAARVRSIEASYCDIRAVNDANSAVCRGSNVGRRHSKRQRRNR